MFEACFSGGDWETGTLLGSAKPKARKQHRCGECRGKIQPGEYYFRDKLLFDGAVSTHKTCTACQAVLSSLFKQGCVYSDLWNEIHEVYCRGRLGEEDFCICPDTRWEKS